MRCTKCHYLSFEPEPRCRNCGHDLSIDELVMDELPLDEPMSARDSAGDDDPLADFRLDREMPMRADADAGGGVATMAPPVKAAAPVTKPMVMAVAPPTSELPLFVRDMPAAAVQDDEDLTPLVTVPHRPRQPLGVRRPTPDAARLRAKYAPAEHEPDLLDAVDAVAAARESGMWPAPEAEADAGTTEVSLGQRLAGAAIDAAVLAAIASVTVLFTLRIVDLPLNQALALPVIPMVAFFALVGLGYELLFTAANGQTIGKMLVGLRVVPDDLDAPADRVPLRQAALRAVSMLPMGAGLLAAVVGGLAVHDRVAHTRVVRA